MCKAIEDMRIESEARGIAIGAIRAYMGMGLGFDEIVKLLCENLSYTRTDAENLTKEYFK